MELAFVDAPSILLDYTPAQLKRLEKQRRRSQSKKGSNFRLLRAPILHTPVLKDLSGTARIEDLDSQHPVGKHLRRIKSIFESMPYFFKKPSDSLRQWFTSLVENLNKFPRNLEPVLKTLDGRARKIPMTIYGWLDMLIRDEGVSSTKKDRLYALEQTKRTQGLGIGEFSELRVELALRILKDNGEIKGFYMARNSHVNDKLGIDALIEVGHANGRSLLIPLQVKSSDKMVDSFTKRRKTFMLTEAEQRRLKKSQNKRPRKADYASIDFDPEFQFKRKIPAINGCDYSITDTMDRVSDIITESLATDHVLKVKPNFNDISFVKKLSVLLQQKFIVPIATLEDVNSNENHDLVS